MAAKNQHKKKLRQRETGALHVAELQAYDRETVLLTTALDKSYWAIVAVRCRRVPESVVPSLGNF